MKKKKQLKKTKWWLDPVFRFVLLSGITLLVLLLVTSLRGVESVLIQVTSLILSKILSLLQIPYESRFLDSQFAFQILDGTKLKYMIVPDCTGIYPFSILTSFIIGYPTTWKHKGTGLLFAVLLTGTVNFLRLTLLIQIGRISLSSFHLWHTLIWQSSFLLLIVGFYFGWTAWIAKNQ